MDGIVIRQHLIKKLGFLFCFGWFGLALLSSDAWKREIKIILVLILVKIPFQNWLLECGVGIHVNIYNSPPQR